MLGKTRLILLITISLVAVGAFLLIFSINEPEEERAPAEPMNIDWPTSTPEEQGFDSNKLAEMLGVLREQKVKIHSLLIVRNGSIFLDANFYPYDGSIPHNLASVTKSFMTTLIGIASGQGKIEPDRRMVSYFPSLTIANLDEKKENITVRHLAGMVNGMTSGCMSGDEATLNLMRSSPDWIQDTLDRKMSMAPGLNFCYDSPGMHLLSAILQGASGMTALEFADEYLFDPLEIKDVFWEADPQGFTHGWGDLYLKPLDAAKLGLLWLNGGKWDGKQVVPESWVRESVQAHIIAGEDAYGYGWWVSEDSYYAMGRGGQYIQVFPGLNAVIVITAEEVSFDTLVPYLEASLVSPEEALPPNPEGVAQLNEMLSMIVKPETTETTIPTPKTAKEVSGMVYTFPSNPTKVNQLRIDFDDPNVATLRINLEGEVDTIEGEIGLDGKYRLASNGWGLRGYWSDTQTFVMEIFDIKIIRCALRFKADKVLLNVDGVEVEGIAK